MGDKLQFDSSLNYRIIFNDQITKAKLIDEKISRELYYLNDLPYEMMEKYGEKFKRALVSTGIDYIMMEKPSNQQKQAKASYVSELGIVKSFMLYKNGVMVETYNGQRCEITPLSDMILDDDLRKKLTTEERNNDCHNGSWALMSSVDGLEEKKLVSGFIKGNCEDAEYPHTWVEFIEDGEEKVADYTLNAIMNKEFYYTLRSIDRDNISEISEEDFIREKDVVESMCKNENLDKRVYLLFHKDFINYNRSKFQSSESGE